MNLLQKSKFAARTPNEMNGNSAVYLGLDSRALSFFYVTVAVIVTLPLFLYAYLGTFSRYGADDYCATVQLLQSDNLWRASVTRYLEWSGGYSNLLFIQIGEWFGIAGMIYMAAAMLILWLIGLTWLISEIAEATGFRWRIELSFILAALTVFFSLYRTPNLHQILFWRSSLVGYLAAIVLLAYLAAFILRESRRSSQGSGRIWKSLLVFGSALIIGGTSETIDALQIGILLLSFLILYSWRRIASRSAFFLLGAGLLGATLSMIIMAFSPGNLVRMGVSTMPVPNMFSLGWETLIYVFQFVLNSLKVAPLPAILSFFMPFLLFYGLQNPLFQLSPQLAKRLKWLVLLLPLGMLIAIAFSFAPHAYARSFPSGYVRFPALFLLTVTLVAEGGLTGYLLSQTKLPSAGLFRAAIFGLVVLTFLYPVRVAAKLYDQVPEYRAHAVAWDTRDEQIRQEVAAGATDLTVTQIDTIGGVQEYKGNEFFWVNRCAADYYGLRSLRAP
jgi:Family of unknown function (DUF6056)